MLVQSVSCQECTTKVWVYMIRDSQMRGKACEHRGECGNLKKAWHLMEPVCGEEGGKDKGHE